ncbi:hypothetical protein ACV34S_35980, partial [Pseudomonas aeruginosa]
MQAHPRGAPPVERDAQEPAGTTPSKFRDVEIRAPRGTTLTAKSWLT